MKVVVILLCLFSNAAFASKEFVLNEKKGLVSFEAIGKPSFLKIHGKGGAPKGTISINANKANGVIYFDLSSLDTDNSLRNKHMKEKYLEVNKYPEAQLAIEEVPLVVNEHHEFKFISKLSLHGVIYPVEVTAKLSKKDNDIFAVADFSMKLSDFKIEIPSYMGIKVVDLVKVHVETQSVLN